MSEATYLVAARKDIGIKEIKGDKHHPRIIRAFKEIGHSWLNNDETPWCAAIAGLWLLEGGLTIPKNAFRALAWLDYGLPSTVNTLGAIAVLTRKGGGHVALVTAISADGKWVRLLGGNQNDMVCEAWFEIERIKTCRIPAGLANLQKTPIAKVGELSYSEA